MNRPHQPSLSRTAARISGFTLIELLVVISIIALLIAILMPTLSAARVQAKQVLCLSNERQIIISLTTYAADHKRLYPALFGGDAQRTWGSYATFKSSDIIGSGLLGTRGYVSGWKVFACPAREERSWPAIRVLDPSTYSTVTGQKIPNATCYSYRGWMLPSQGGKGPQDWSEPTVSRQALVTDIFYNPSVALLAHQAGTNVGYSDGSAKLVQFENNFTPWAPSDDTYLDAITIWAGTGNIKDTQHMTTYRFFDTQ